MKVVLTGGTGFIGSHVLAELQEHGHEVTALVRNDARRRDRRRPRCHAGRCRPRTTGPRSWSVLKGADGAIHTASPGDETSADLDSAVVDAAIEAFDGTGKPYLHITGGWVYGDNLSITEESPIDSPAMVAWRGTDRAACCSMRAACAESSSSRACAYGDGGGGVPGVLLGSPRDDAGNLIMLGSGRQHWATVHVADLADVFRRALEDDSARGSLRRRRRSEPDRCGTDRGGRRRRRRFRARSPVPTTRRESRLGDYFAEVLLLDQSTEAAKARAELGWSPSHPGLVDEFRHGSYRTEQAAADG